MEKKKFNFSGILAFVLSILVLAIFVPINLIASYNDNVIDMTPSGQYTLNEVTEQLLDETADKQIEVYFLSKLIYLQQVPKYLPLYHTLTELEKRENITLTCFDPNENTELAKELNPTGLLDVSPADIFVKCGDTIKRIDFRRCFQTDSNGILEYAGEELIAGAIHICARGKLPTVYFVSGYSDKTLEDNYSNFADVVKSDNYAVEELDLSSVDKIPEETAIVYLAGIDRDISKADRDKLSEYLENGGSVSMFIPPSEKEGRFENIEYLLSKFELTMDYNKVSEKNAVNQLQNLDSEQDPNFIRVSYPTKSEDFTEDLTTDVNSQVSNGRISPGISNTRSFSELTSQSAMIEKAPIIENLPESMDGSYTTKSEPCGGDSDTRADALTKSDSPLAFGYYSYNKQNGSKLILFGSDEMISDEFSYADKAWSVTGSRVLAIFSNTWLSDSDIDMGIGTKSNAYDTMHFSGAEQATSTLRIFLIIPAVIALLGVAVWLKRRYA